MASMTDAQKIQALRDALELVLLFYSTGWGPEKEKKWERTVGHDRDFTSHVLCDHVRVTLEITKEPK